MEESFDEGGDAGSHSSDIHDKSDGYGEGFGEGCGRAGAVKSPVEESGGGFDDEEGGGRRDGSE